MSDTTYQPEQPEQQKGEQAPGPDWQAASEQLALLRTPSTGC
ncbi:hypothetical protein [Microbulbifer halophilus]